MAILKRTKTDLINEGNQSFLQSTSQNKSCQNLFRKNNRIEFSTHPWAGSDSVPSAGVGLANTYQTTLHASPSPPTTCARRRPGEAASVHIKRCRRSVKRCSLPGPRCRPPAAPWPPAAACRCPLCCCRWPAPRWPSAPSQRSSAPACCPPTTGPAAPWCRAGTTIGTRRAARSSPTGAATATPTTSSPSTTVRRAAGPSRKCPNYAGWRLMEDLAGVI